MKEEIIMTLNANEPQTVAVRDSSGEKTNIGVASNFSRLTPEEQRAVNWHVDLQFQKAVRSGNMWAANNKNEFIQNGREGMATNNEEGLRNTVAMFNDPVSKARIEAMTDRRIQDMPRCENAPCTVPPLAPTLPSHLLAPSLPTDRSLR
jgi:hypothetical protein